MRRVRWRGVFGVMGRVVVGLAVLAVASACRSRPAPGDKCRVPNQLVCAAGDRALVCDSGTWLEVPCKGTGGCARRHDVEECDDTLAAVADPCPRDPARDYACAADHAKALVCKEGRFGLWRECRGPDGCRILDGRNLRCDTTLGEPGDPCERPGTFACSADRRTMLVCDGSVLLPASSCRGPEGCRIEQGNHKVDCDDSLALEGDPCDQPKRIACAVDRKAELACEVASPSGAGKHYVKKRECQRSDCRVDATELFCD
jgi:hypothetical protein